MLTRKDGSRVTVEIRTTPIHLDGRSLILGIARDVTERKHVEDQLREAEGRYRTLVENANDAILLVQNNKTIYRNQTYLDLLGYSVKELAAQPFLENVVPEDRERILRYQEKRVRGEPVPQQYEITIRTRSGKLVPVELKPRIIEYYGHPAVLVVMRDISERKRTEEILKKSNLELERKVTERTAKLSQVNAELRAEITERRRTEEALRASEEKYRDLVENINDVIFATDGDGNITYVNDTIGRLSGYTRSDLIGTSFLDFIHPEDFPRLMERFQRTPSMVGIPRPRHDWRKSAWCLYWRSGFGHGFRRIHANRTTPRCLFWSVLGFSSGWRLSYHPGRRPPLSRAKK